MWLVSDFEAAAFKQGQLSLLAPPATPSAAGYAGIADQRSATRPNHHTVIPARRLTQNARGVTVTNSACC